MPTLYKLESFLSERDFDPTAVMHDQENIRVNTFNEGGYTQEVFGFLGEQFKHHVNFLSLSTIRSYETLSQHRCIASTDGLIPLVDFFIRFSRPGNSLKTVLLIPHQLKEWVPRIWSDNVMLYSVNHSPKPSRPSHNIFVAITDQGLNSPSELQEEFLNFKKQSPQSNNNSVLLLAPSKAIIPAEVNRPYEHIRSLINAMDENDQFIFPSTIDQELMSKSHYYFSSKIKYLKINSELEQRFLANGSKPINPYTVNDKPELEISISAYHCLNIYEQETFNTDKTWDKINYDVSRLGVVDNLIGQDMSKLLIKQASHIGSTSN